MAYGMIQQQFVLILTITYSQRGHFNQEMNVSASKYNLYFLSRHSFLSVIYIYNVGPQHWNQESARIKTFSLVSVKFDLFFSFQNLKWTRSEVGSFIALKRSF